MNRKNRLNRADTLDMMMRVRDGIIMTLSSTPDLNSAELSRLTIGDVDAEAGCLRVRSHSGTRSVPLASLPMHFLDQYIRHVRPHIGKTFNANAPLFVSVYDAEPMTPNYLQKTIKHHLNRLDQGSEPLNLITVPVPFGYLLPTFSPPFGHLLGDQKRNQAAEGKRVTVSPFGKSGNANIWKK